MPPAIVPVSEVSSDLLHEYLASATQFFRERDASMVRWKYYDATFSRGKQRGFVWLRRDKVRGFIGVMPAAVVRGRSVTPLNWTCDWGLADPKANPGMGVVLLRHTISNVTHTATLGGNENTQSLAPRIAAQSFEGVGMTFARPLRASALLRAASGRLPLLTKLGDGILGRLRVPWYVRRGGPRVQTTDGVLPRLDQLFDAIEPPMWTARYDVPYLQWALERCPDRVCVTCFVEGDRGPVAAALVWHRRSTPRRQARVALWSVAGAVDALSAVVGAAIRYAQTSGAELLSAAAARWDEADVRVLQDAGFFARRAMRPLYLFSRELDRFGGLNYFATDLAQRI